MSDERNLTEEEMQASIGAGSKVPKVPKDRDRKLDAADLQDAPGGARAVRPSEVPGDSDDGRIDPADLTQAGGTLKPTQVPDDDDILGTRGTRGQDGTAV